MQKNHLRDYVKNLLQKIDKTNKYHPIVIDHALEKAINGLFAEIARKTPQELDQYTKSYDLGLSQEGTSDVFSATLTAGYVTIPDKQSGIRLIEGYGDFGELKFIPMTRKEFYIYPNTYSKKISDRLPYYFDRTKIYVYNPPSTMTSGSNDITVHQLLPFTEYASTDNVRIPSGQDDFVVKKALEHLGIIQPVDLANDNRDIQKVR